MNVVPAACTGTVSLTLKVTLFPLAIIALPLLAASKVASRLLTSVSPMVAIVTDSVLAGLVFVIV